MLGYFGDKMLSDINGTLCRAYVRHRGSNAAARRELEDFRAAIHHHRREGLCTAIVEVALPPARLRASGGLPRRGGEAVKGRLAYTRGAKGQANRRRSRQHVARFILVALYRHTRRCRLRGRLQPTVGRGWIDLDRGVFYRRAEGERETKKRKPPIPVAAGAARPFEAVATSRPEVCRRVERRASTIINKAFRAVAADAGLGADVTPHVLRHTAATWLMQAGTAPWEAAGFLGMTAETLIETLRPPSSGSPKGGCPRGVRPAP